MARTILTPEKARAKFLAKLRTTGNVTLACQAAHCSRTYAYELRNVDIAFAREWEAALEEAGDHLEAEARRRAEVGVTKPVYQGGERVGEVQEYSDTLLIFLLKGAKPAKYRERHEHSGPNGGPVRVGVTIDDVLSALPSDFRERVRAELAGMVRSVGSEASNGHL